MNKMRKTKERTLLEGLYKAVINYFDAENAFRDNPTDKTLEARWTADSKLTTAISKVESYLHPNDDE
jgi:hypothetical protein